jgi:hypothetical protein
MPRDGAVSNRRGLNRRAHQPSGKTDQAPTPAHDAAEFLRMAGQALRDGVLDQFDRRVEIELIHDLSLVKLDGSG